MSMTSFSRFANTCPWETRSCEEYSKRHCATSTKSHNCTVVGQKDGNSYVLAASTTFRAGEMGIKAIVQQDSQMISKVFGGKVGCITIVEIIPPSLHGVVFPTINSFMKGSTKHITKCT